MDILPSLPPLSLIDLLVSQNIVRFIIKMQYLRNPVNEFYIIIAIFSPQCSSFLRVVAMVDESEEMTSSNNFSSSLTGLCFFES